MNTNICKKYIIFFCKTVCTLRKQSVMYFTIVSDLIEYKIYFILNPGIRVSVIEIF